MQAIANWPLTQINLPRVPTVVCSPLRPWLTPGGRRKLSELDLPGAEGSSFQMGEALGSVTLVISIGEH